MCSRSTQEIEVQVLSIDRDQARVALSLKRCRPDPWKTVGERYCVGQVVSGMITNVVNFGAFISVEDGLEGLIHVSELAKGRFCTHVTSCRRARPSPPGSCTSIRPTGV